MYELSTNNQKGADYSNEASGSAPERGKGVGARTRQAGIGLRYLRLTVRAGIG